MEALFEITCTSVFGTDTAYAEDAEGAYLARWQLPADAAIQGKKRLMIRNLVTGEVVLNAEV